MNEPSGSRAVFASDPIAAFQEALARARSMETSDPTAMALATADVSGRPAVRMVLLKGADERGFVFFTNRESRKADDLTQNSRAALCIHWPTLQQQIRVEGRVERASDDESDAYFASRPRGSQIAAWASRQSAPVVSRDELLQRVRDLEAQYAGVPVPRPAFWGGYRVVPERIEFWWGQADRLHERLLYSREERGWRMEMLQP